MMQNWEEFQFSLARPENLIIQKSFTSVNAGVE